MLYAILQAIDTVCDYVLTALYNITHHLTTCLLTVDIPAGNKYDS